MKVLYKIGIILSTAFLLNACSDKETLDKISVVDSLKKGEPRATKFDKYLEREFLKPYNIEVQYRLNDIETDMNYNVVPAKEEKAIKLATLIKYLCLDTYKNHSDKGFLEATFPKSIVFVGSSGYKSDGGSKLLGTAQGGVKIMLYDVNSIDVNNKEQLLDNFFNTIFHEFSHILHQKKHFSEDFEKISDEDYKGDQWNARGVWTKENPAYAKGFITRYASNKPEDDFVEIISHYITLTNEQLIAKINPKGDNEEGFSKFLKKLGIVKSYLLNSWNLNIDDIRAEVQEKLKSLSSFDVDNIN